MQINKTGRIAGAVGVAGVAAVTALTLTPGTFGSFSASASNPGNTVSSGTVHMTDNVTGHLTLANATLLTGHSTTNMAPGDSVSGSVTITNSGSLPASATLTIANVTNTVTPASDWTLNIVDGNNNTIYNGTLAAASAINLPDGASGTPTRWAAGDANTYTVTVGLSSSASNEAQDNTPSFDLNWANTQA